MRRSSAQVEYLMLRSMGLVLVDVVHMDFFHVCHLHELKNIATEVKYKLFPGHTIDAVMQ